VLAVPMVGAFTITSRSEFWQTVGPTENPGSAA
jgi:hypothetical protein